MEFAKLVETCDYLLEILNANSRKKLRKSTLVEVREVVLFIQSKMGKYAKRRRTLIAIENLLIAINAVDNMDIQNLPEEMKDNITDKLYELREEICLIAYRDLYTSNVEFEVNKELIRVFREIVTVAVRRDYVSC